MRLGFDVGGTKTDAVAVAPNGDVVARARRATGWGADAVVGTIAQLTADLTAEAGCAPADIVSVGIGVPGQVAPGSAQVRHAVNLGIEELDLGRAIGSILGVPVGVENDVKAAALGALALHHPGARTLAYLNLGTGVAAGIVTGGTVWRGTHGTAGEIGHISIDPAGPLCPCGQRGCIEVFAGGGSLARRWSTPAVLTALPPGALPVRDLFDAADAGDPRAVELRRGFAQAVAAALRVLVLSVDVEVVVVGGGLAALGERLRVLVAAELASSAAASPFLRSLRVAERLVLLPPGSPAAAFGAALVGATAPEQEALFHG